jgi:hypothetical protein
MKRPAEEPEPAPDACSESDDDFQVDVAAISTSSCSSAAQKVVAPTSWWKAGPSSIGELMNWPTQYLSDLHAVGTAQGLSLVSTLEKNLLQGIVLTTSYTGTGSVECAMAMIAETVGERTGKDIKLVVYSACDLATSARQCLQSHHDASRPRHVFGDLLDRLAPLDQNKLNEICKEVRAEWFEYIAEPGRNKFDRWAMRDVLGSKMKAQLLSALGKMTFLEDSYCHVHQQRCPLDPKQDPELSGFLHIEGAGNTCTPWCASGDHLEWLDTSTLANLVWACHTRFISPDGILGECAPRYQAHVLDKDVFKDLSPEIPRSSRIKDVVPYDFETLIFNAVDLGIPSSRERRWSFWGKQGVLRGGTKMLFQQIFFRRLACSCKEYLQASAVVRHLSVQHRAMRLLHLPDLDSVKLLQISKAESVLQPAQLIRLRGYRRMAEEKGYVVNGTWQPGVHCLLVDLSQNSSYTTSLRPNVCFALRRNSEPFDLVQNLPLESVEHFVVQGFPVPGLVAPEHSRHFPFPDLLQGPDALSEAAVRVLTGNAMCLPVAGAMLLFCLAS